MMYKRSNAVIAFIIMIVLLSASISIGIFRSWSAQRAEVEKSIGSLNEFITERREIGFNILSVAKRHPSIDQQKITDLQSDITDLDKNNISFSQLANVIERFEYDAAALLEGLKLLPSVQADNRDVMYVEQMLPQALEKNARMTEMADYNQKAEAFNKDINTYVSGKIALILGVKPAIQFVAAEVNP